MEKKKNPVTHFQTALDSERAREFQILCLKLKTTIKAKLKELILSEIEFWQDTSDEEIEEILKAQGEGKK